MQSLVCMQRCQRTQDCFVECEGHICFCFFSALFSLCPSLCSLHTCAVQLPRTHSSDSPRISAKSRAPCGNSLDAAPLAPSALLEPCCSERLAAAKQLQQQLQQFDRAMLLLDDSLIPHHCNHSMAATRSKEALQNRIHQSTTTLAARRQPTTEGAFESAT